MQNQDMREPKQENIWDDLKEVIDNVGYLINDTVKFHVYCGLQEGYSYKSLKEAYTEMYDILEDYPFLKDKGEIILSINSVILGETKKAWNWLGKEIVTMKEKTSKLIEENKKLKKQLGEKKND